MDSAVTSKIRKRTVAPREVMGLVKEGVTPLLARVLAGRGIDSLDTLGGQLRCLHHHSQLFGAAHAAALLADGIAQKRKFLVVADYDCDGATACAVALRGLRAFGADIEYIVPDRMIHGYGLTPSVVELAMERFPETEILLTVDNGVASHAGVEAAKARGLQVVVTDHHLPSKILPLPPADVIVDPSLPMCTFPSKALAGVGVIWYVLWALQDELRARNQMPLGFKVSHLLPLVAVGTVADVVPLDRNNRSLVQAGLDRIREGNAFHGIYALATVGVINRTDPKRLLTSDIAFGIGPRINAAGRLQTMDIGISCLITDDQATAQSLAQQLDDINQERKDIENDMAIAAVEQAEKLVRDGTTTISVHSDEWHAGVIGIVAGRIKEKRYRPTFVLTTDPKTGQMKGSGRSIPGFNLKDVLDQVHKAQPGLMPKFGGHAMAAGVTLAPGGFELFRDEFERQANQVITPDVLQQFMDVDGSLAGTELTVKVARSLQGPTWGQMFPEPTFADDFVVVDAKITGVYKNQLNMTLEREGVRIRATRFRHEGPAPEPGQIIQCVYKLNVVRNRKGDEELKLLLDAVMER